MVGLLDLRHGADGPAVIGGFDGGFELVLAWTRGRHGLDEGEEEGAVFDGAPLGCHGGDRYGLSV